MGNGGLSASTAKIAAELKRRGVWSRKLNAQIRAKGRRGVEYLVLSADSLASAYGAMRIVIVGINGREATSQVA